MEALLVSEAGETKEVLKAKHVKRMFQAVNKVLNAEGLNFSADEEAMRFKFLMSSDEHTDDHVVIVKVQPHFVVVEASWTYKLTEGAQRKAGARFVNVFNDTLTSNMATMDLDLRDGELRCRAGLPVGLIAKQPEGLIQDYVKRVRLVINLVLPAARGMRDDGVEPAAAGREAAQLVNAVVDVNLSE